MDRHPNESPKPSQYREYMRFRGRRLRFAGLILLALAALTGLAATTAPDTMRQIIPDPIEQTVTDTIVEAQPGLVRVTQVIDGDTIEVELSGKTERVRMIGVDTPETHDPRKPVQCYGELAAAHTKELLNGKSVRLEPNPQDSDRDKYHRLLRYVYLPDGTLINAQIIQDGFAFAYTIFPHPRLDEFRTLEREAREANHGLWAGCNVDESQAIKQTTGAK